MSRILIIIALLSLISLTNVAATLKLKLDTLAANNYFNRAESLWSIASYDSASMYYKRAAQEYKNNKIWDKYLLATFYRGNLLQAKSDKHKEAIEWLLGNLNQVPKNNTTQKVMSKKADIHLCAAYSYRGLSKYHEAIIHFDKALQFMKYAKKDKTEAIITGKAVTYWYLGDHKKALTFQENALTILQNDKNLNSERLIIVNNILGLINVALGNYHIASEYYHECLRLLNTPENANEELLAVVSNNLGIVHDKNGSSQKAIEYYDQALNIFKKNNSSRSKISSTLNDVGKAYLELGKYDEAKMHFKKSLEISLELFNNDHLLIARSYFHLAEIYKLKNQYDSAEEYYNKAIKMRLHILGKRSSVLGYTYNKLADLFEKQGTYDKALESLNKAILSNSNKSIENLENYSQSELFKNSLSELEFFYTSTQKASIFRKVYEESRELEFLISSLQIYELCDSFVNKIRYSHQSYSDRIESNKIFAEFYNEAITLCQQLFNKTKKEKYIQQAFHFSERSKAAVLYASMMDMNARKFVSIPDSLLIQEKELKIDLAFYKTQEQNELIKTGQYDTAKLDYAQKNFFDLSRKQEGLMKLLENNYPKYYQLKYNTEVASIDENQNLLDEKTTLLEYFIGDSTIYTFTLTKDSLFVYQQPKPIRFDSTISTFQKAITEKKIDKYTQSAMRLYNTLIAPIENYIKGNRLIIIPGGALWQVNFDLLLTSNKPIENYKELDYLLKDYAISYAYSANLLYQEKHRISNQNKTKELLAFSFGNSANITGNTITLKTLRNNTLEDLPGSREEIRAIADIFNGQYYYGNTANEHNFKTNASNYSILHLALHGEIDNTYPNNSKLHFTQNKDSLEDGYLYAYELYNMSLNAELAVLSACNTGSGKLVKGEGIMSLGRAFTYAGCKSLVLTQWEVPDATTPQIMKDFYQGLKDGLPKDEALRLAKLNHLASADKLTASPFYWGSFILLGDSGKIDMDNDNRWIIYGMVVLFLIIVVFIFIRNSRLKTTA